MAAVGASLDRLVPHGATVILAVSGGPDSTALAHLVTEARPDLRASVAHVRHGLRDDAEDARVAAAHAAALGLRFHERHVRVEGAGEGPEAAARRVRYAALARVARTNAAPWVLVGHTADDQAETLLLNLARGTGLRGLAGMAETRAEGDVRIVRPLLRLRREDVRAFVAGEGLASIDDPTNADRDQRRWRARHTAIPVLGRLAGGSGGGPADVVAALTRMADLARDDADALDALAAAHARRVVRRWGPVRAVQEHELAALPPAVATRVLRLLLSAVRGGTAGLGAEVVAGILALGPGQSLHVPGGAWVTCGGGWLAAVPGGTPALARRPVAVPGVTPLSELGLELHADLPWGAGSVDDTGQGRLDLGALSTPRLREVSAPGQVAPRRSALGRSAPAAAPAGASAAAPAARPVTLAPPPPTAEGRSMTTSAVFPAGIDRLAVRARQDGDRLRLRGGSRKLQDILVDHGVPRAARDLIPVVTGPDDEPLWVPGVAVRAWDPDASARVRLWLSLAHTSLQGLA